MNYPTRIFLILLFLLSSSNTDAQVGLDRLTIHVHLVSAFPVGSFGSNDPVSSSGFATWGFGGNFETMYSSHRSQSFYLLIGLHMSYYTFFTSDRLEAIIEEDFNANLSIATTFELEKSNWGNFNLFPGIGAVKRFNNGMNLELKTFFGPGIMSPPEFRIDNGNYIPADYAKFFQGNGTQTNDSTNDFFGGMTNLLWAIPWKEYMRAEIGVGFNYAFPTYEIAITQANLEPDGTISFSRTVEVFDDPILFLTVYGGIKLPL